jgi:glycosyltransferase involved in cell wall biosynthesis
VDSSAEKWHSPRRPLGALPRRFIYAGSPGIGMAKDHVHTVVDAFVELKKVGKPFHFSVVGMDEKQFLEYHPSYEEKFRFLGDSHSFLGRLSHCRTLEEVRQSDFFVFLRPQKRSSNAGFPTKFVEAIACGTPPITNATSDIPKYLETNRNGFLLKRPDVTELTSVLLDAINLSPSCLQAMKIECQASNPFRFQNFQASLAEFLEKAQ